MTIRPMCSLPRQQTGTFQDTGSRSSGGSEENYVSSLFYCLSDHTSVTELIISDMCESGGRPRKCRYLILIVRNIQTINRRAKPVS